MSFQLKIITPEKQVFDGIVDSLKCPGLDGLFGILSSHAPMVSALGDGDLVYINGAKETTVKVSGGFLEVKDDVCSVMTDSAD